MATTALSAGLLTAARLPLREPVSAPDRNGGPATLRHDADADGSAFARLLADARERPAARVAGPPPPAPPPAAPQPAPPPASAPVSAPVAARNAGAAAASDAVDAAAAPHEDAAAPTTSANAAKARPPLLPRGPLAPRPAAGRAGDGSAMASAPAGATEGGGSEAGEPVDAARAGADGTAPVGQGAAPAPIALPIAAAGLSLPTADGAAADGTTSSSGGATGDAAGVAGGPGSAAAAGAGDSATVALAAVGEGGPTVGRRFGATARRAVGDAAELPVPGGGSGGGGRHVKAALIESATARVAGGAAAIGDGATAAATAGFAQALRDATGSGAPSRAEASAPGGADAASGTASAGGEAAAAQAAAAATTPSAGGTSATAAAYAIATPVASPDFRQALGLQVSVLARGGIQHAELQLNPPEMGPISVSIELDGNAARVDFGADSAGTRQAIESGFGELAASLQAAGFTLSGGGVSQHAPRREPGRGDARPGDGSAPRGATDRLDATGRGDATLPRPTAWRGSGAGIDLYA